MFERHGCTEHSKIEPLAVLGMKAKQRTSVILVIIRYPSE